jgi:hypothetical protein
VISQGQVAPGRSSLRDRLPKEQVIIRTHSLIEKPHSGSRAVGLAENVLCNHAFISPKSLNRRLCTVQNPLLVGLPIGLQKENVLCTSLGNPPRKMHSSRVEQAL